MNTNSAWSRDHFGYITAVTELEYQIKLETTKYTPELAIEAGGDYSILQKYFSEDFGENRMRYDCTTLYDLCKGGISGELLFIHLFSPVRDKMPFDNSWRAWYRDHSI